MSATLALSASLPACSDESFTVQHAAEFPRGGGYSLSVLGVYRDGRLAPEAWDLFRTRLTPLFGIGPCEPGYPDILAPSGTAALQAVDDFSRDNGVTDELMDKLAPMAKGDMILLVTLTGRPTKAESSGPGPASTATVPARSPGRHGMAPPRGPTTAEPPAFEAVGIVFSVKAHRSVAAIRMTYTGSSMDDALDRFVARLGQELPHATCAGWKSEPHIDASDIRRLGAE